MRVVFAGTPDAALPSLRALLAGHHEVAAVLTRPDAPAGRGRRLVASPVAVEAEAAGVPVLRTSRLRGDSPEAVAARQALADLAPDCCPVVAYGALVPADLLALPALGWVNLHFSLLPAWRGAAPVQHALLAGDEVTGATTFRLDEGLDTGPVLGVVTEAVLPRDTAGDLLDRLATSGAGLLAATLDGLEAGALVPVPQPVDGVSFAPKLEPADALVTWDAPAVAVDRLVRACTPAPGAWTTFRGERLGLEPVEPAVVAAGSPVPAPGELRVARSEVLVGTAPPAASGSAGAVRLGTVRPAGRRPMPATDWARGVRPADGERLGG